MKVLVFVVLIATLLLACAEGPTATRVGGGIPTDTPSATDRTEATQAPAVSDAPPATETTIAETPEKYAIGETIEVSGDFISAPVRIRVAEVKEAKKYGDFSKPGKGNVYLAVKYEYEAVEDGGTYNPFDWQIFVDGTAAENFAFVMDGPQPELSSGTLPKGRKAEGWVVYEVPKEGEVVLSYGANMFGGEAPTFEIIAREG